MAALQSLAELRNWDEYREFLKAQANLLSSADEPFFISKEKVDFEIKGSPWRGYAVLVGRKAQLVLQKLRKEGFLFREGSCRKEDKTLVVSGFSDKLVRGAGLTLGKLMLGFKVEAGSDASTDGDGSGEGTAEDAPLARPIHEPRSETTKAAGRQGAAAVSTTGDLLGRRGSRPSLQRRPDGRFPSSQ